MFYQELHTKEEIPRLLQIVKSKFKNLAQITAGSEYETTMKQTAVCTLFHNLVPAMKIEGEPHLLDLFKTELDTISKGYHPGGLKNPK